MNNFMKSRNVFPFAFNPENPMSRQLISNSEHELTILFDMTSGEVPEASAIAIQFGEELPKITSIKFSDTDLVLSVELKTAAGKYFETIPRNNTVDLPDMLAQTTELCIVCWRSVNKGKKSTVTITY